MTTKQDATEITKKLSSLKADFSSLEDGCVEDLHTEEFLKVRQRYSDMRNKAN